MSMRAITWAMSASTGSSPRKLLLIMLADNADNEGMAWPEAHDLAAACEMSVKSVKRAKTHFHGAHEKKVYLLSYYRLNVPTDQEAL